MTTLKERLDGKLPPLSTFIWEELEKAFTKVEPKDLANGVTISVFKNDTNSRFCYIIDSSKSKVGTKFSFDFDYDTLEKVIKIAEENGLLVEPTIKGSHYKFIYSPTWSK